MNLQQSSQCFPHRSIFRVRNVCHLPKHSACRTGGIVRQILGIRICYNIMFGMVLIICSQQKNLVPYSNLLLFFFRTISYIVALLQRNVPSARANSRRTSCKNIQKIHVRGDKCPVLIVPCVCLMKKKRYIIKSMVLFQKHKLCFKSLCVQYFRISLEERQLFLYYVHFLQTTEDQK